MKDFRNKVAVITGGATGIGFALARALGNEGAKIMIAEPREAQLQASVTALRDAGIDARYHVCDVSDLAQVEALADSAWEEFGQVDMIFNNAGISNRPKPLIDMPVEEARAVFDVNFFGVWHGCQVFARRLIKQGTPAGIFNTGSENALFNAVPNHAAYVCSKHAVLGLTDSLREQMPDFIQVGLINPGWVQSEMTRHAPQAMAADTFAGIVLQQIRAGQFYIVSHPYNQVRIQERYDEMLDAFVKFAPRYPGDDEHDVRTVINRR
ncbi:MAG: SDR family NAD(P)-dependent oxidoreductase [Pseudomonadales bacterium]|nr:SDR family NAD(P)-dependent oxidoreductase [Pseudomonadales bacterium]